MFTPDTPIMTPPVIFDKLTVPDDFSILCWNVHKENLKKNFTSLIKKWKQKYRLDLILLQEAMFSQTLRSIAGFPFIGAANIRFPGHFSGVVTATGIPAFSSQSHLTMAREAMLFTRKNTLITTYRFKTNARLMVVNIHAINFRSPVWYKHEFSRLYDVIKGHIGPMILAGDFNCWGQSRERVLDEFIGMLDLEYARPGHARHVKKWFGSQLDRIYTRGLILHDIQALNCKSFSDHNPIVARFIRPD